MKKYILTVGPALLNRVPLQQIHQSKHIYRINGAHGSIEDIEETVSRIRKQIPEADILIDLPGNKIRTKGIQTPIQVKQGEFFSIPSQNFNYPDYYRHLEKGMTVWANDSIFEFVVEHANAQEIKFLSKSTGLLQDNKGMHVRGIHSQIPFLFEKDRALIALCTRLKIPYVGLSFVRTVDNVREAKALLSDDIKIISKIETEDAVKNLTEILEEVSMILVDRGDLSTEVGLYKLPQYQRYIIETAHYNNIKVFLATQVLKTMEKNPLPTIAELNDLYSIFKTGIYGVQMSEETAVGEHVEACIHALEKMDQEVAAERFVR